MGRNRTPTPVMDAKGSFLRHPERARSGEPKSDRPLGNPPRWLTKPEKRVWRELAKEALPGVLLESDRLQFALLVRLATQLQAGFPLLKVGEMSTLITLGSKFAMNPADRSKVVVGKPKESKLAAFLNLRKEAPGTDALNAVDVN